MVLRARFGDRLSRGLDVLSGEIGAAGATTEDYVYVLVAARLDNGSETLLGDTHERMGVRARAHRVNSHGDL